MGELCMDAVFSMSIQITGGLGNCQVSHLRTSSLAERLLWNTSVTFAKLTKSMIKL